MQKKRNKNLKCYSFLTASRPVQALVIQKSSSWVTGMHTVIVHCVFNMCLPGEGGGGFFKYCRTNESKHIVNITTVVSVSNIQLSTDINNVFEMLFYACMFAPRKYPTSSYSSMISLRSLVYTGLLLSKLHWKP